MREAGLADILAALSERADIDIVTTRETAETTSLRLEHALRRA